MKQYTQVGGGVQEQTWSTLHTGGVAGGGAVPEGYKEMSTISADQLCPNAWGRGEVAGSQPMGIAVHSTGVTLEI